MSFGSFPGLRGRSVGAAGIAAKRAASRAPALISVASRQSYLSSLLWNGAHSPGSYSPAFVMVQSRDRLLAAAGLWFARDRVLFHFARSVFIPFILALFRSPGSTGGDQARGRCFLP